MKSAEIRRAFQDFFQEKEHTVVPSASLVPDDPTLLFTNAGMVQFKNVFLGNEVRSYQRAVSVQKCMRVSGKHNDLENVGPSPRHNTFFEMLGNFSFGDYFKREAISYAWEFLIRVLGLPKERFHFTVFREDEESFSLWQEIARAAPERVHRMGETTNFWMMGDTGPCGPNTELVWDRGARFCDCKRPDCSPHLGNDCNRWSELWNLVFMQYDRAPDGSQTPLPQPGVDTGMGFERLVSVVQSAATNYETDLFQPIMQRTRKLLRQSEQEMRSQIVPYRVIADHGRAMTFLIADGVIPSNETQGYVLRMIMRRAIRFGKKLGFKEPFLSEIAHAVMEAMASHYSELGERRDFILQVIAQEEERFEQTLEDGLARLSKLMDELERKGQKMIPGIEAFKLHDTFGFPWELTVDVARERGFSVDRGGFAVEMEQQRRRSKKTFQIELGETLRHPDILQIDRDEIKSTTRFVGYESYEQEAPLWKAQEGRYVFEITPFYAESGGQVADTGWIENLSRSGKAEVLDVRKSKEGTYRHIINIIEGTFAPGDRCLLIVDRERRQRTMRNHTATHILHAALRKVLGYSQGIQKGSLVAPDELRFDFTHFAPLTSEQMEQIEMEANHVILSNLPVKITEEKLEDAKAKGAMALFTEDYQGKEKVRVVSIVSEDGNGTCYSMELCGGTHVKRTGEIGLLKIIGQEGVASGVRRVYVATGDTLLRYVREQETQIHEAASKLKTSEREFLPKLEALLEEREALEHELRAFKREWLKIKRDELLQKRKSFNTCEFIAAQVDLNIEELKELADLLENSLHRGIVLLGSGHNGKVVLVCKVSETLTKEIGAGDIVREAAQLVGGKGGGNPRFAQGAGDQPEKLPQALATLSQKIQWKLSKST
jgi:alanyl-tRNA synthetase